MSACLRQGKRSRVILSRVTNIYHNLALENWLLHNTTFSEGESCLLVYQNTPCVVVGRFQNPWREADVEKARTRGREILVKCSGIDRL